MHTNELPKQIIIWGQSGIHTSCFPFRPFSWQLQLFKKVLKDHIFIFFHINHHGPGFLSAQYSTQQHNSQVTEVTRTQEELEWAQKAQGKEATWVQETLRGRCWPACNQAGASEAMGTHYILHTHTPHLNDFFCPLLANHPKEMNKLHPFRISPPALNYHKQMQHRLTNRSELRFGCSLGPEERFCVSREVCWHRARSQGWASPRRRTTEAFIKFVFVNMHSRN